MRHRLLFGCAVTIEALRSLKFGSLPHLPLFRPAPGKTVPGKSVEKVSSSAIGFSPFSTGKIVEKGSPWAIEGIPFSTGLTGRDLFLYPLRFKTTHGEAEYGA
jgi:hypothetical protein